jgi:hypothetical protein
VNKFVLNKFVGWVELSEPYAIAMPKSARFRTLTKELNRLKKQFIPKIHPGNLYSDRQLALTLAYIE